MRTAMSLLLLFLPAALLAEEPVSRGHNPGGTVESLIFGVELAVLGMAIVFVGLLLIFLFMTVLRRTIGKKKAVAVDNGNQAVRPEITEEVVHAIALALFMDLRTFDDDDADEITIRKITRPFSPWMDSSKTALIARSQYFGKRQ
jgi:Na+-transporting methylmalonyl-CoA/oxaloacetate decarboxylase gamma subunit